MRIVRSRESGNPRVGLVSTVSESVERLRAFVNYHLNIGIERLFLCLDNPLDPALDAIKHPSVIFVRCDRSHWERIAQSFRTGELRLRFGSNERYYRHIAHQLDENKLSIETRQVLNATWILEQMRSSGINWLLHLDGDELLYVPNDSVSEVLLNVPPEIDSVRFSTLEAVPETSTSALEFDTTLFKSIARVKGSLQGPLYGLAQRAPVSAQVNAAKQLGCRRVFFDGEYFRGHSHGKSASRISTRVRFLHIHEPALFGLRCLYSKLGYLLHYDCMTFDAWVQKWRRRFDNVATAEFVRSNRARQGEQFIELYRAGDTRGLRQLYERLYYVPSEERGRLLRLGLLKRLHLSARLFATPA